MHFITLSIVFALVVVGCGSELQNKEQRTVRTFTEFQGKRYYRCQSGIDSFKNSVHALVRKDCLPCHDVGGKAPPHAVADPAASYLMHLSYVDWENLENSKLIQHGGDQHCKKYGVNCVSTTTEVRAALKAWWENGQKDCPVSGKIVTRPLDITATNQWKTLKWELSNINEDYEGVFFEVEVKLVAGADSSTQNYALRKPRFSTLFNPLQVEKLTLNLNGMPFSTGFDLAHTVVGPKKSGKNAVLSSRTVYLPVEDLTKDKLSVGFMKLEASPSLECKNETLFAKNVLPVVALRNCYACHGGNGSPGKVDAKGSLDMSQSQTDLCSDFKQLSNLNFAVESPLIGYPLHSANGHPQVIPFSTEVFPSWTEWISKER